MEEIIEVEFYKLVFTKIGFSILLKPKIFKLNDLVLPIFIGPLETDSISNVLENKILNRPLAHDLISNILDTFYISISSVVITHMIDNNLYAKICFKNVIDYEENTTELTCRPSDGIAIALRQNSPIFVNRKLIEQIAISFRYEQDSMEDKEEEIEEIDLKEENLELLNQQLEEAIKTRNYELAVEIRDKINKINSK